MSELKHTPGPWKAGRNSAFWEVDIQDGFSVAYVWGNDEKQAEANARLIAAAPELLKLADRVAGLNPGAGEIGPGMLASLVEEARAAITKATGAQ